VYLHCLCVVLVFLCWLYNWHLSFWAGTSRNTYGIELLFNSSELCFSTVLKQTPHLQGIWVIRWMWVLCSIYQLLWYLQITHQYSSNLRLIGSWCGVNTVIKKRLFFCRKSNPYISLLSKLFQKYILHNNFKKLF